MQENFYLADGVSEAKASTVFNNVAWKLIKDTFKQVHYLSVATYYTQVLKQQMKPTQVKGTYLTKGSTFMGRSIGWLRIWRPGTSSMTIGYSRSLESCQSRTGRTG
jgi:K+/H+ antiporter YhaU regulatory subunit KhtT